jgi:CDP-6-deoxy-D-xylo-4-hexulose-3-dehydrase
VTENDKLAEINRLIGEIIDERKNSTWNPGQDTVQYAGSTFTAAEYQSAVNSLLTGWLGMDKKAHVFERKFPTFLGKASGVLTNSGSSANLLMIASLTSKRWFDLPKGTKVITPVAGFPTTVNPILQMGFTPLFVDIEPETLNIDVGQLEEAAKGGAKVVMFAHVLGNPPNMRDVMTIVKKYDLILLEDCCDALGSTYEGRPLGSFGEMASCSFYPAHHMTMGEGGFVAVKDKEKLKIVQAFRDWGRGCYCAGQDAGKLLHGTCGERFKPWLESMPETTFDHKYVYEEIGFNLKPIELQAAMGLEQMKKLSWIKERRKQNFNRLLFKFDSYSDLFRLPKATPGSDPSWFAFPVTVNTDKFTRSEITQFLESRKIQTRTYFGGNILMQPAYRHLEGASDAHIKFPVSTMVTRDTFFLGTSPVITDEQVDFIGSTLDEFIASR